MKKAYSNRCIDLKESDAWLVYYYGRVAIKAIIRYDLIRINEEGILQEFENIYPGFENLSMRKEAIQKALNAIDKNSIPVCDCRLIE